MKIPSVSKSSILNVGIIAVSCLFAFPEIAQAKGPKGASNGHGHGHSQESNRHESRRGDSRDRDWNTYSSHPRSGFVLSFGTGYAGSGYYYGPPNSPYYYQRSDVRYYSNRAAAPREYYARENYRGNAADAAVQRSLSQRGYYNGRIDGQIGYQSRRAIARYQRDHGMQSTGYITSRLLRSLGLQ